MAVRDDSIDFSFNDIGDFDVSSIAFSQNWSRHVDEPSISFLKDSEDPRLSVILPRNSIELAPLEDKPVHKKHVSEDTSPTVATKHHVETAFRLDRDTVPAASCSDCFRASVDGSCRLV
mmetsp:Transcript_19086/g.34717  ORF Transcript_19086/g.34717 Transcript_19086/m.34717 type:complete len:119 (-) Transcript_19086:3902-4258(-)